MARGRIQEHIIIDGSRHLAGLNDGRTTLELESCVSLSPAVVGLSQTRFNRVIV
jgi:hypothetical protein